MISFRILLTVVLLAGISIQATAAGELDVSKALVIGSGTKIVYEFTDPDCPFCRKASSFFDKRPDVKRYVYFYPLARHPRAREKTRFILSMPDKAKAYHDVMSGRMDSAPLLASTPEGVRLQEEQLAIVKKNKVTSTPTFMINGRIIEGFDQKKIEEALGPRL